MGEAEGLLGRASFLERRRFWRGGGRSGTEQEGVAGSNSGERGPAFGRRGWRSLLPENGVF